MKPRHIFSVLIITLLLAAASVSFAQDACAVESGCTEVAAAPAGIAAAEIEAYPKPEVVQLAVDDSILNDRAYRRVASAIEIHDAPNGNVINTLAAGFNFVTTQGDQDGWTQINSGEWVKSESLSYAAPSTFSGVLLTESLPYPMAWVMKNTIPSRTPGAEPLDEDIDKLLLRYAKVNLYSYVEVDGWRWYQIGVDQWIHQTLVAKIIPVERFAEIDTYKWVSVDLYEQVAIAYEDNTPVFATLVSSGLPEWSTDEGLFHVYVRYPRTIMSGADGQSDFYFLEEVPWTMYFNGDMGLHGTYWHDGFGYRHSHGCVNLSITDAYWLYNWASSEIDLTVDSDLGAAVYVYSSGEYK